MRKKTNYKWIVAFLALVAIGAVTGSLGLVSMGVVVAPIGAIIATT